MVRGEMPANILTGPLIQHRIGKIINIFMHLTGTKLFFRKANQNRVLKVGRIPQQLGRGVFAAQFQLKEDIPL